MNAHTPMTRRKKRGSVTLEFAIMLPFLLVLFLFAWDVIFFFNYQILGSYAAFSAARSYAVFQDEDLARDVAAAVMSCATIPVAGDSDRDGYDSVPSQGVQAFLDKARGTGFLPGKREGGNPFASARGRISFQVKEVDTGIGMRKGYAYSDSDTTSQGGSGGWFTKLLKKLGLEKAGERNATIPAKVAHVTMTYDYPVLMGYLRTPSFVLPQGVTNLPASFSIYNACACPIEPKPTALLEMEAAETNQTSVLLAVEDAEELQKRDKAVKSALKEFYVYAQGVHDRLAGELLDAMDYSGPDWLIVDKSSVGHPQGNYFSGGTAKADTAVWWPDLVSDKLEKMPTQMRKLAFDPRDPSFTPPGSFKESLDSIYQVAGLYHPQYTLTLDIAYRRHVDGKIGEEISGLSSAISQIGNAQKNIVAYIASQGIEPAPGAPPLPDYLGRANDALDQIPANVRSRFNIPHASSGNAIALNSKLGGDAATLNGWMGVWSTRKTNQNDRMKISANEMSTGFGTAKWSETYQQLYFGKFAGQILQLFFQPPELNPENKMGKIQKALHDYYAEAAKAGGESISGIDDVLGKARNRNKKGQD